MYNMDIVAADSASRARAYRNLRADFVKEHNRNVSDRRTQMASDLFAVDTNKRDQLAQSKMAADFDEGQQTVSAFIDAGATARAGKTRGAAKADALAQTLTGKTTGELSESLTDDAGESGRSVAERDGAKISEEALGETGAKVGSKAMIKGALKGAGKIALKNAGGAFNIGLGGEALYDDFQGGTFHLAGKNGLEEASNVLQIGSGVADAAAFFFPPAAAVGALLGVASSVAEGFGKREEEEKTEEGIEAKARAAKDKINATDIGTIMKAPPKVTVSTLGAMITPSVSA